jgi:hypothetical protein
MKAQYTQLSFDFEFNQVSTVVEENKCEVKKTVTARYTITKAEFEAQIALENDLINGRGAWLYQQLQRELAHERKAARALAEFEALRAEAYKYNL